MKKMQMRKRKQEVEVVQEGCHERNFQLILCFFWIICVRRALLRLPFSCKKPMEEKA